MSIPDEMDKRLEEEIGEILDSRAGQLPQSRSQKRKLRLTGKRGQPRPWWWGWAKNGALTLAAFAFFFLVVRLGPLGALRLLPVLAVLGLSAYIAIRVSRYLWR